MTPRQLEMQIKVLKEKHGMLSPTTETGEHNKTFYSLGNKIKQLEGKLFDMNSKQSWNKFLAQ